MANRRPLSEGIKPAAPPVDSALERKFVYQNQSTVSAEPPPALHRVNRVPISTRFREDIAVALKRASLERQLKGVYPHTSQDILDLALESWLKLNGHL